MLRLTRKWGEAVTISPATWLPPETPIGEVFANAPITIRFEKGSGAEIEVSIDAPRDLSVLREDAKQREPKAAGSGTS